MHPSPIDHFSGIERIWCGKEDLRDSMVSKMIEDFNCRQILGGLNYIKIRELLQGFRYEIIYDIDE